MSRMRLITVLVVLGLAGTGAWVWQAHSYPPAPQLGFRIIDGRQLDTAALRGRPVLVQFWATSCAICMRELPDLAALYRDYAGRGLQLIAVAMPYDPPSQVLEVARRQQLPFPVALDLDGRIARAFGDVSLTPTTILIDARGRIVARDAGAHDFAALRRALDALLDAVG